MSPLSVCVFLFILNARKENKMVTKKAGKKKGKKGRVKTIHLKREAIKDLSSRDKKKVKGGGGALGGVTQSRVV